MRARQAWAAVGLAAVLLLAGCTTSLPPPTAPPGTPPGTPPASPTAPPATGETYFHERARLPEAGRVTAGERTSWPGGGAALHDANGDRKLDAWISGPEGVRLVLGNGTLGPRDDATAAAGVACDCRAVAVAPADWDNDNDTDLFVQPQNAPGRFYRNDGGGFTLLPAGALAFPADGAAAGWLDLDNDGLLDLLILRSGGDPVALRPRNGTFEVAPASVWPAGAGAANAGAFVDLNADGFVDVVLAGPQGLMAFRNGNGSFAPAPRFASNLTATALTAGDVDNSQTQDLVVASKDGLFLLLNAQGNRFREPIPLASPAWSAVLLDADLDGLLDIVAASREGGLMMLRNAGGGNFDVVPADRSGLPASGEWRGLAVGDWDGDGRADLLATRLDGPPTLFHNGDTRGHFYKVLPRGVASNRDGLGTRAVAVAPRLLEERYVLTGFGLATSAPEVTFGLGNSTLLNLRLQWPSGTFQDLALGPGNDTDRILVASEEQSLSQWGDAC